MAYRNLYELVAAGTALTNSTAETVLASYTIPAYAPQVGKRYRVRLAVVASSTNSTDTLRVRLRAGPTTLTGTVIVDGTAVDVANADLIYADVEVTVRSVGSSGAMVWGGLFSITGAEGTATARSVYESTTPDLTAALRLEVTGTWSVASASNICAAQILSVDEIA